jgi:1-deoxyxylulose-5-phosphate synthase
MDYVRLGSTGLKVSRLCLGCMTYGSPKWRPWVLDEEQSLPFFKAAIEAGINFFDTADMYSLGESERVTGKALKEYAKRHEVVIATKVFSPMGSGPNDRGLSRKHILDSIDRSLSRLGVDYVDLYQIHRFDPDTPIEETLEALNDVVRAGKARYIGASSMYAWQFMKMLDTSKAAGWTPFVSMQPQYNLVYREEEREMLPLCRDQGVGVIPWSPLARGKLTRPWDETTTRKETDDFGRKLYRDEDRVIIERVLEVAAKRDLAPAQLALAWLLRNPVVTSPIVGVTKSAHLSDAISAVDVDLDADEVDRLEEPYVPHSVAGHQ